jgi:hypothetical protein
MTFIASSFLIEVLGGENVDLEMPKKIFGNFWGKSVKTFSKAGAKMINIVGKISSKLEVLRRDGVKIVLVENNL